MKKIFVIFAVIALTILFVSCGTTTLDICETSTNETTLDEATAILEIATSDISETTESQKMVIDYSSETDLEKDLNTGVDIIGKSIIFTVKKVAPNSFFGYNLQSGEHLNFILVDGPFNHNDGDTVTAVVNSVTSALGSWIISITEIN